MTKFLPFYFDRHQFLQNDKSFMITGKHIAFWAAFFNSSLFKFCFADNFPKLGEEGRELRKIFLDKIPVLQVTDEQETAFAAAVKDIQQEYTPDKAIAIDKMIFDVYKLTQTERKQIGFVEIV